VGGIIYFAQNLESDEQTTEMLSNTQNFMKDINGIGLFLCVDEEGGVVARIGNKLNANTFQNMDVYGENADPTEAYQIGVQLAENLSKYGFNVDFAPVSDVDLNSGNGLENRCFSADPNDCATMVENIVKGIQDNGISATIKHFPGLGSSTGDTHDDISYLTRTKEEFETVDFIPIKAGINADTDFVMVSHMVVNGLSDDVPCDLSQTIVTQWLRNELNFEGIAITDSHQMSAITKHYTSDVASVMAIEAGIDVILMPEDLEASVSGVVNAVTSGEISEERIDESVTRILNQKEDLGLLY
jgi:beta-N-acetylhexosaminidase